MKVTITNDNNKYDLFYGETHILGGEVYEISEEQLKQIQTCDYTRVQSVIRNITLTSKKVGKIFKE